jgi:hypothetical protein
VPFAAPEELDTEGVVTMGVCTGGVVTAGVTGVGGTVTGVTVTGGTVTGGTVTGGTVTGGGSGSGGCCALAGSAHIAVQMTTVTPRHQRRGMSSPSFAKAFPVLGYANLGRAGYC